MFSFATDGERVKFETVYDRYKGLMLHKAYGVLHDRQLAEDAVSEAFIRIYKNMNKLDTPDSSRTAAFVMTVVRNTALTLLGRRHEQSETPPDDQLADGFDLEGFVCSELSAQHIYMLLNQVSEELRSVFLLKYAYDLSHLEIGRLLGITENNVTVRLHRARKKIAELLSGEGNGIEQ